MLWQFQNFASPKWSIWCSRFSTWTQRVNLMNKVGFLTFSKQWFHTVFNSNWIDGCRQINSEEPASKMKMKILHSLKGWALDARSTKLICFGNFWESMALDGRMDRVKSKWREMLPGPASLVEDHSICNKFHLFVRGFETRLDKALERRGTCNLNRTNFGITVPNHPTSEQKGT